MVAGIRQYGLPAVSCVIHTLQLVKDSIFIQKSVTQLSANDTSISQVIPFIETLKEELRLSKYSDLGIKTTKQEMLKSLKSQFRYIYNDDNFVIATLLDPCF